MSRRLHRSAFFAGNAVTGDFHSAIADPPQFAWSLILCSVGLSELGLKSMVGVQSPIKRTAAMQATAILQQISAPLSYHCGG